MLSPVGARRPFVGNSHSPAGIARVVPMRPLQSIPSHYESIAGRVSLPVTDSAASRARSRSVLRTGVPGAVKGVEVRQLVANLRRPDRPKGASQPVQPAAVRHAG